MSSGKQLVKGKSGLRMIAVSENERCPFLLEEPRWTADTQVYVFPHLSIKFLVVSSQKCYDQHSCTYASKLVLESLAAFNIMCQTIVFISCFVVSELCKM